MQRVTESEWNGASLINPTGSTLNESATRKVGAGGFASLNGGDLNPDCPVAHKNSHNDLRIVSSQKVVVPPKSRVVLMGRLSGGRQSRYLPHSVMVEPVSTRNKSLCRSSSKGCFCKGRQ